MPICSGFSSSCNLWKSYKPNTCTSTNCHKKVSTKLRQVTRCNQTNSLSMIFTLVLDFIIIRYKTKGPSQESWGGPFVLYLRQFEYLKIWISEWHLDLFWRFFLPPFSSTSFFLSSWYNSHSNFPLKAKGKDSPPGTKSVHDLSKPHLECHSKSIYRKNSKNWDTWNNYHNCPTIGTVGFYSAVLCSKDANRITNREDPDQTSPWGAVWSGSALFAQTYLSQYLKLLR